VEYDPVKDRLQALVGKNRLARRVFFSILDRVFLRSRYVRREIERLKRGGFEPQQILDAGSGFGQYSFRLSRVFPQARITGLDLKEVLVQSSNEFWRGIGGSDGDRIHFEVGNLLELTYDSQFDLALSVDVMEHIEEDELVFRNIGRSLKPGGLFIMTTPYYDISVGSSKSNQPYVDEHVRPGYSRSELTRKLAQGDMIIEKFVITYGFYGNVAWTLLQKWPMSWLSRARWLVPLVALYFIPAYALAWIFMRLDMAAKNQRGGGILAVARKQGTGDSKQ
jgi:2-polyprenyl-3-methyl-5-hydroxy-6-metoxy-1,4-benzoquinol methylase